MVVRVNGSTGIVTVSGTSGAPSLRGPDGNSGISFDGDQVIISSSGLVAATFSDSAATINNLSVDTTTLEFSPGSSGTPTVAPSGDLNTGIYFPAADTIGFAEGGNEAARIDSSGRFGIGTASPTVPLQVNGTGQIARFESSSSSAVVRIANTETNPCEFVYTSDLAINVGGSERTRIDSSGNLRFNSGYGSVATAYGCRAWVNFDGTSGSIGSGRANGNVSSITDNGTGDYTVNFTTAMPDANYSVSGCGGSGNTFGSYAFSTFGGASFTTSSFRITVFVSQSASKADVDTVCVAIFR